LANAPDEQLYLEVTAELPITPFDPSVGTSADSPTFDPPPPGSSYVQDP